MSLHTVQALWFLPFLFWHENKWKLATGFYRVHEPARTDLSLTPCFSDLFNLKPLSAGFILSIPVQHEIFMIIWATTKVIFGHYLLRVWHSKANLLHRDCVGGRFNWQSQNNPLTLLEILNPDLGMEVHHPSVTDPRPPPTSEQATQKKKIQIS